MFSTVQGMGMQQVKIDKAYVIGTNGYNPRIYEWTAANGMKCIALFSSSNEASNPAMQCSYPLQTK